MQAHNARRGGSGVGRAVQNQEIFTFEQAIFSQGVATVPDARLLQEAQIAYGLNCYPARSGRLRKRGGHVLEVDTDQAASGPVRAVRRIVTEAGSEWLVIWRDGKVFAWDGTTLTELADDLDTEGGIAHEWWHDKVFYSDGATGLRFIRLADEDVAAWGSGSFDAEGVSQKLRIEALEPGAAGNGIEVSITVVQHTPLFFSEHSRPVPVVSVDGDTISVQAWSGNEMFGERLQSGSLGMQAYSSRPSWSTIKEVADAINAHAQAKELVRAVASGGSAFVKAATTITTEFGQDAGTAASWLATDKYSFVALARRNSSERLFGVDAEDSTNVRWCAPFDATKWDSGDVYSPGGTFTALLEVASTMCLFTVEGIYRIDGSDPQTWRVEPAPSDGLGCIAPATICAIEGTAVYLSPRGVAFYDGTRPRLLSVDQFDERDSDSNIIDVSSDSFAMTTGDHYWLVTPGEVTQAAVFDFVLNAWGGPYHLGFHATCGTTAMRGSDRAKAPTFGLADGAVATSDDGTYTDLGEPFTMLARFKTVDAARPLMDKVFDEVRLGYECSGEADVSVRMHFELDGQVRNRAEVTRQVGAGGDLIRKRIDNARARSGYIEVETDAQARFEVLAVGCDLFFPKAR